MDDIEYLGASGSVLSYNLYQYCENNPIYNVDEFGNLSVKVNSDFAIFIGFISIIVLLKDFISSVKDVFKLVDKDKLATILLTILFLLPITATIQLLAYYVEHFITVIITLIISINLAMLTATLASGGAFTIFKKTFDYAAKSYLPDITTSVKMIINGLKGRSYKIKFGFLSAKYSVI